MATQQDSWHLPDLSDRRLLALGMASQRIDDGDDHALRNSNLMTDEHPVIAEFRRILRTYDATGQPPLDTTCDPAALVQEGLMECLTRYGIPGDRAFLCLNMLQECQNDRSRFIAFAEGLARPRQDGRIELHGLEAHPELAGLLRIVHGGSVHREAALQYMLQRESRYSLLLEQAATAVLGPSGLANDVGANLLAILRELYRVPGTKTRLARILEHLSPTG